MAGPSRSKTKARQATRREVPGAVAGRAAGSSHTHGIAASVDLLALAVLLITSVIVTWPMWRDGHATYVDNPAHLAEIHSLAFDAHNGWSNLAYCGYPLGSMHSPIWYGLLTLVARSGLPLEPFYAFMVWLGFLAPPLALFFVARRSVPAWGAAGLACLLMLQRTALLGLGSAMAGMWTSYLGAAGVILLVDRISRPCESQRDLARLAAIVALTALTHLYTLLPMLILGVVHAVRLSLQPGSDRQRLLREAGAGVLGALIASMYWLQPLLVRSYAEIIPNDLSLSALLARLLLPVSLVESRHLPPPQLSWIIDAAPMFLLVLAGVLGVASMRRRRTDLPLYGLALFVVFAALLALVSYRSVPLLGNYSWRMLYYVRIGMALTAIPFVAFLMQRLPNHRFVAGLACIVAIVCGLWFSQPLDRLVLRRNGLELQEIRTTWDWLREHQQPGWGRVYVQGTFGAPALSVPLRNSHILALTARQTGVEQLGAFYGGMPIRTTVWTTSEFGRVFGRELTDAARVEEMLQNAFFSNSTHLLLSDPRFTETLQAGNKCDVLFRSGPFAVLAIRGVPSSWLYSETPGVEVTARVTGSVEIDIDADYPGGRFLMKEAFHPFWRISGSAAASLHPEEASRLVAVQTGPGPQKLVLRYAPPRWPFVPSLIGIAGWLLLMCWRRRSATQRAV